MMSNEIYYHLLCVLSNEIRNKYAIRSLIFSVRARVCKCVDIPSANQKQYFIRISSVETQCIIRRTLIVITLENYDARELLFCMLNSYYNPHIYIFLVEVIELMLNPNTFIVSSPLLYVFIRFFP